MLHFPKKLSLYREGSRLWYMSEIANILRDSKKMHEVFLSDRLIESSKQKGLIHCIGGIKSKGTAWGYINNAVSLGIIRSEGTWKGTIKARILTLTCLGEALSLTEEVNGKRLEFPKLNMFEKILFLKRFLELDELWNGNWIYCIIMRVPENEYREEKKVIEEVSGMIPQLKNLKPRTKEHRIFPKLQWLVDLDLIEVEEKGTQRSYKLSQSGCILKRIKDEPAFTKRHYTTIAETYKLEKKPPEDVENLIMEIFNRLKNRSILVPIPLIRYVACVVLLLKGMVMEEDDFDDFLLNLVRKKHFQLHQCPYKTVEPEIFVNGKRYYYISEY